jgi:hypothetical protein
VSRAQSSGEQDVLDCDPQHTYKRVDHKRLSFVTYYSFCFGFNWFLYDVSILGLKLWAPLVVQRVVAGLAFVCCCCPCYCATALAQGEEALAYGITCLETTVILALVMDVAVLATLDKVSLGIRCGVLALCAQRDSSLAI